jgi:hypothetical protein
MNTFFIHDGRNEVGPFTLDVLKGQIISRNTPVRHEGSDQWMPAEKIAGLKEIVLPRKIKRPKDIVPVIMERAADFRQRRPRTAYAILFCIALIAGVSLYSLDNKVSTALPKAGIDLLPAPAQTAANAPLLATGVIPKKEEKKESPKSDKEKAARLRWNKLFSASNSNYGIGLLGGIKDLKVVVTNRSDYPVEEAVAKLTYIKANGEVWKTKLVTVYGVPANDSKEQSVPDVSRGKKVTITLHKIVSKKMKFRYTAGKRSGTADDPYLLQ